MYTTTVRVRGLDVDGTEPRPVRVGGNVVPHPAVGHVEDLHSLTHMRAWPAPFAHFCHSCSTPARHRHRDPCSSWRRGWARGPVASSGQGSAGRLMAPGG